MGLIDAKSITRQVDHARDYAERKGWAVDAAHIYTDDQITGALFGDKRPGLARLLNALSPRPPFQVLIMSDGDRLGRESIETGWTLKQILDAGVRVFTYLDDHERTLDTALDKVMLSLSTFAGEMEREKARLRTHDALVRRARAGFVTGGLVYGYQNREVTAPDGRRSHVVRAIHEEQAAVVRRIFADYAAGVGMVRIAKRLNAEGIAPPRT